MLKETITKMTQGNLGILAADESVATITKRFQEHGIPTTPESRFQYRKMLLSSDNLSNYISSVILHEETLTQMGSYCSELGIIPGIKVDLGLMDYNGHKVTKGIDVLSERLPNFKSLGARFCKWRAVYSVTESAPVAWEINATGLAMYARICQQHDLVPIVEPEILLQGDYSIEQAIKAHQIILSETFEKLSKHDVNVANIILKPSMVLPGSLHSEQVSDQKIAEATVSTFLKVVPHDVPSINFLSGGQSPEQATSRLKAIQEYSATNDSPFRFSFSYARALQEPSMKLFASNKIKEAQFALIERSTANTE